MPNYSFLIRESVFRLCLASPVYDSSGIRCSRDEHDCREEAVFLRAFRGGQGALFFGFCHEGGWRKAFIREWVRTVHRF